VQVIHRLAAPSANVGDQPKAIVGDPLGSGEIGGGRKQSTQERA